MEEISVVAQRRDEQQTGLHHLTGGVEVTELDGRMDRPHDLDCVGRVIGGEQHREVDAGRMQRLHDVDFGQAFHQKMAVVARAGVGDQEDRVIDPALRQTLEIGKGEPLLEVVMADIGRMDLRGRDDPALFQDVRPAAYLGFGHCIKADIRDGVADVLPLCDAAGQGPDTEIVGSDRRWSGRGE